MNAGAIDIMRPIAPTLYIWLWLRRWDIPLRASIVIIVITRQPIQLLLYIFLCKRIAKRPCAVFDGTARNQSAWAGTARIRKNYFMRRYFCL
ncbi:hypothetical protein ANACOL_02770 [Anaerotruncus colihominis DSM 17241]|uniref:Uncharacterized protein n=1 Tax=Anaerotruncus colihominis DSM 17241 TaxID=445972 RepID=B0PDY5_9FIRM|nr:hypothetical protein ANACOL_02770 [Anaerotruncus colihominis DSM 17241]